MNGKNHPAILSAFSLVAIFAAAHLNLPLHAHDESLPLTAAFEADTAEQDSSSASEALEVDFELPIQTKQEESSSSDRDHFGDWLGYNSRHDDTTWIASKDFGMVSFEEFPTLDIDKETAILFGTGFHFLNGPFSPDMPPRLFDFQAAFQTRQEVGEGWVLDIKTSLGAYSDFEGSARKGIRFPGHVVSYYEWQPRLISVLGIDVLDRDDISLLPVGGFVWRPNKNFVCECVFPRPRLRVRLDSDHIVYLGGELGGGTWATERADLSNDNVTYSDYRVAFGIKNVDSNNVIEIGWAFDRSLEYRSGAGDAEFEDALLLRFRQQY